MDIEQLVGTELGNYKIVSLLGRGGMGIVYKARQISLNRLVALKILPPALGSDASFVKRFKREARSVARLSHSNIIQIFDITEAEGLHFFSMEYVEGKTLDRFLKERGRIEPNEAIRIIYQVALALEHAHGNNIIHRDIKPSNIILDKSGNAKIMDFGLAFSTTQRSKITRTGTVLGTVDYMSPEQARGEQTIGHRTDIWSLGVVLYEMVTGENPFNAANDSAVLHKILYEEPAEARALNPDVPPALSFVVSRSMAKNEEDRYADISEFLKDLGVVKSLEKVEETSGRRLIDTRSITRKIAGPSAPFVAGRRPFVGRQRERAELRRVLGQAALGQGSLVMIGGEPGVGKSRLIEEFVIDARQYGFLCLTGHCYETEGGQPYMPFVEIIESAARIIEPSIFLQMLGGSAPEVAKLVPELRRKFPDIPPMVELPLEQEQRFMFNGVLDFLERAALADPLLLVLEDLHWSKESNMLLMHHAAPRLNGMHILLVGTYRDTDLAGSPSLTRALRDLMRQRLAHDIELKRLSKAEVADMLRELSGREPPSRLIEVIYQETEGNPFFVEEIFRHLTEREELFDQEGQWRRDLSLHEADVPRGVRLVLGHRIQQVDKPCLETLTVAAAVGRAVGSRLLEQLVNLDEVTFLNSVEQAERAHLIRSTAEAGDVKLVFSHELIRQTVLSNVSGLRRQRLHFRVAEAMERIYANNLNEYAAELAYHFKKAGVLADAGKTARYLQLAGDGAFTMGALDESIESYRDALSLLESDEIQADIRCKLGMAYCALGRVDEALDEWRQSLTLYENLNEPEKVGNMCSDISPRLLWASRFQEALEISNRGLAALGDRVNAARCVLLAASGHVLAYVPAVGYDLPRTMFTEALEMAAQLGEKQLEGPILYRKAMFHRNYWQGLEETDCGLRSAKLLRERNNPFDSLNALLAAEWGLIGVGRLDEAADVERELETVVVKTGAEVNRCVLDLYSCLREVIVTGDLERLESRMSAALQNSLDLRWGWISMNYGLLGWAQFWHGDWGPAENNFRKAIEMMDAKAEGFLGYMISPLLVFLALSGRRDEALDLIEERRNLLPSPGQANTLGSWTMLEGTTIGLATLGKYNEAAELYPLAREAIATGNLISPSCAGLVQTLAGIAATAGQLWDLAEEHFETALKQAHELPHVIEQPEVRRWYARMLMERKDPNDRDKGCTLLTEAIGMYRKIGMPKHLEMAEELLKKMNLDT